MKIFKNILSILMFVLNIPFGILMTSGSVWYLLPSLQKTKLGLWLSANLNPQVIFWITIVSTIFYIAFLVITKIFNKDMKAKIKNFFTHSSTWLITLVATVLSIYAFIVAEVNVHEFELTSLRKIGIGVNFILLFLAFILSNKLSRVINRKVQAYETAKEMNVVGRGSVIWVNMLKMFEILFPEVLVLLLICFCLSWNVSVYFIIILVSFVIPAVGNIECDFNTRAEIKRLRDKESSELVNKIAEQVKGE